MKVADEQYIHTTIHDFKTHISKYIRLLEREHYRAVILYRRNQKVGIFIPYEVRMREAQAELEPYS